MAKITVQSTPMTKMEDVADHRISIFLIVGQSESLGAGLDYLKKVFMEDQREIRRLKKRLKAATRD